MQEDVYRNKNMIIFNFSEIYFNNPQEITSSLYFVRFLKDYIEFIKEKHQEHYVYLVGKNDHDSVASDLAKLARYLLVFDLHEIDMPYLRNLSVLDNIIEEIYNYWRKLQRFSLIYAGSSVDSHSANFIENDTKFNNLVIGLYRSIQEKIRGIKFQVYRQLQAGTNAAIVLRDYRMNLPEDYKKLTKVPFINSMMLRTPLILYPQSIKREGTFDELNYNPLNDFEYEKDEWMIYPAKVGTLLAFIYFHRDFLPSVSALSGLFELAPDKDCLKQQPDLILLFGNKDGKEKCLFYDDFENDIVIGSVSYSDKVDYFGYLKKMTLTLHNIKMIRNGGLPIHGAMVNITLKSGVKKGIVLIGDSGAGKSESIEALQNIASEKIEKMEIIYDDMGTMFIEDDKVYCTGTEIGAFIRLDDLEKGSPYRDMDRSVFFNPHRHNARLVLPVNSYKEVSRKHFVDLVLYANNYTKEYGIKRFTDYKEAEKVFLQGKRMSLGTTDEDGIVGTYFANPFGPQQRQDICNEIFKTVYQKLFANDIYVGEIYTHLGLQANLDELTKAASALLELMEND